MDEADQKTFDPVDHLLPQGQPQAPVGPTAGVVIILVLLVIAAIYFWGQHLNGRNNAENNLPLIPADNTTAQAGE